MDWKIGQKVICDRADQSLSGTVIQIGHTDGVIISCPESGAIVCGLQKNLERFGWQIAYQFSTEETLAHRS